MQTPDELWRLLEDSALTRPNSIVFGYFRAADRDELEAIVEPLDIRVYGFGTPRLIGLGAVNLRDYPEKPAFLELTRSYKEPKLYRLHSFWKDERPEFSEGLLAAIEGILSRPSSERVYLNFEPSAG